LIANVPFDFALSRRDGFGFEKMICTLSSVFKLLFDTVPLMATENVELVGSDGLAQENNPAKISVIRYVAYCRYFICFLTIID